MVGPNAARDPITNAQGLTVSEHAAHSPQHDGAKTEVEQRLDHIHWQLLRGDGLRGSLASRAGSVLSTDALIVAGVALALGFRGQRPNPAVLAAALVTFACVAVSVVNASMALMSVRRWHKQFGRPDKPGWFLYSYIGIASLSFEEFKKRALSLSQNDLLELALAELWREAVLHGYRYRKLRLAVRWLLIALGVLLATIALAARLSRGLRQVAVGYTAICSVAILGRRGRRPPGDHQVYGSVSLSVVTVSGVS
jgi:hypothetical protein